jgi:hypothetical protein
MFLFETTSTTLKITMTKVHLEFGKQWKVIAFHMFCMDRRVYTVSI